LPGCKHKAPRKFNRKKSRLAEVVQSKEEAEEEEGENLDLQHLTSHNSGRRLTLPGMFLGQLGVLTGRFKVVFLEYDECMQGRDVDLRLGSG
jgi:hypothetical protein